MQSIVLAAGQGTRMRSDFPKVLHPILGKPMIEYVLEHLTLAGIERHVVIVGHGADQVKRTIGEREDVTFVLQEQQLGTGHAVLMARDRLKEVTGETIIICGDTPLIRAHTLSTLCDVHRQSKAAATILTTELDDPYGYGRIIRDEQGNVLKIVEEKDSTQAEKAIREINTGTYCFDNKILFEVLGEVTNNNEQGEYYLTDVIELMKEKGYSIAAYKTADAEEILGINDRKALAKATEVMQRRINERWMELGVTIVDPKTTYISPDTVIGKDTIIYPGTIMTGRNVIGSRCLVGPHTELHQVVLKDEVTVRHSVVTDSVIGKQTTVGPFVHLRNHVELGEKVRIGNFVELKKTKMGDDSKASHLSYLGDSTIGKRVNIGCGAITVNYNGVQKFETTIDDDAFIGCNVNLIAPVQIGRKSVVAAGSTITDDVPEESLAIARERQTNKVGYYSDNNNKKRIQ